MCFTRMPLLCNVLYMLLLMFLPQFHLRFQRSKTLPWKIFPILNHYRLSLASEGSSAEELGLCGICSFLVLAHVHKKQCHDLMGLSETIMLKV